MDLSKKYASVELHRLFVSHCCCGLILLYEKYIVSNLMWIDCLVSLLEKYIFTFLMNFEMNGSTTKSLMVALHFVHVIALPSSMTLENDHIPNSNSIAVV